MNNWIVKYIWRLAFKTLQALHEYALCTKKDRSLSHRYVFLPDFTTSAFHCTHTLPFFHPYSFHLTNAKNKPESLFFHPFHW